MPHTSKKYRKTDTKSSNTTTYIVVGIIAVIAAAGGWYAYTTFAATSSVLTTTTSSTSTSGIIYAKIYTSDGIMEIELFQSLTPHTVNNFVNLSKTGFYDNLVWHRIVPGFVIQTGDPNSRNGQNRNMWGQGTSSPSVPLEAVSSLHNDYGYLALAHTSQSTSGSCQFYINLANNTNLDGQYTVFGKVISGMNVALNIASTSIYTSQSSPYYDQPINPVYMINVTILSSGP
jgi:dolichyl-diphosphooligosaccharide---protein glycosyltransferase